MGSAINDTTRELGGALGIAVLGSMISSGFSTHIAKAPAVLPEALRTTAESSLAAALSVAQELGIQSVEFTEQARAAFMSGTSDAMFVSFIIALAAAALIGVFLPNRSTPEARSEAI